VILPFQLFFRIVIMQSLPNRAILLLSGGMDSTTLLWWMKTQGISEIHTVSIDYGQRHLIELTCSAELSRIAGAQSHRVLKLDLTQIGGSPLTDAQLHVPAAKAKQQISTVVPYRNMLFVTLTAAWAETQGITDIFLSPVKDDEAAYRDCRRPFYDALESALSLGATHNIHMRTHTPFVDKWKIEVVKIGLTLGVPYEQTHTCYEGTRPACGRCDACTERLHAFRENNTPDPLQYAK
jgi:7-cyano-7-deazaguanine synthase